MSCFFYLHKDMSKHENVWKAGIAKTPYSAVRARQKYCWETFQIDYLYFGRSYHISALEEIVKRHFYTCSGKYLNNNGSQTELFQIDLESLKGFVDKTILTSELDIKEVKMESPYTASNSGTCPFGIPSEQYADVWLNKKITELFHYNTNSYSNKKIPSGNNFNSLFELVGEQ